MSAPPAWYLYVLLNPAGIAYTGIAIDVDARLAAHNAGSGAKFTRGRGPWTVTYMEGPFDKAAALRRELQVKRDRLLKTALKADCS
ncbi:MAG: GIY-YIG nuclease family protein [Solirubrobacterales bacterium]